VSELRHDPIQKQWVIVATQRGQRPSGYHVQVTEQAQEFCPLCPTNESKTPPEIFAVRGGFAAPNSPGWQLRVVPNKYPAVGIEGDLDRSAVGMYDRMRGVGAHEIIIETPQHNQHLASQPVPHLAKVVKVYRDRMKDLLNDARFLHVMIFRNQGESAGATLAHPHSQVIALPILPKILEIELESSREHYRRTERCLFCDILRQEQDSKTRMVVDGKDFAVFAPYASRSPYELFLMPKVHHADFTSLTDQEADGLAATLSEMVRRLKNCLDDPPFNFIIHSSPNIRAHSALVNELPSIADCYHWHIEVIPRLSKSAGFEWGTGFHINVTPPEEAAENLRSASVAI
jgi:UDPglucose--hexose-1-phosphate uridylyltransferase